MLKAIALAAFAVIIFILIYFGIPIYSWDTPADVPIEDALSNRSSYRFGFEMGCASSHKDKGFNKTQVLASCKCEVELFDSMVTDEQWKEKVFMRRTQPFTEFELEALQAFREKRHSCHQ